MKLGFMSSVHPTQTLSELVDTAKEYGYQGIEFRVEWDHNHGIELTASDTELAQARDMLADNDIAASCIATGVKFNMSHRGEHVIQREILRHYIALAAKVGAPYIRTFGDGVPEDDAERRNKVLGLAAESYAAVDDWAGEHGVTVLLETHTNMYGEWARQILDDAQADNLGILWHIGHHLRRGKSVAETYPHIRGHVRHLHFQAPESRPESTPDEGKDQAGHLVFPSSNEGRVVTDADNQETFDLLAEDGFQGFFSVEYINPENPDEILERHARKFQEYMSNIE